MTCSTSAFGGAQTCYSVPVPAGKAVAVNQGFTNQQATGTAIPSGFFHGWQFWQATIVMQLVLCLLALAISAVLLPPVRKLPWQRRHA